LLHLAKEGLETMDPKDAVKEKNDLEDLQYKYPDDKLEIDDAMFELKGIKHGKVPDYNEVERTELQFDEHKINPADADLDSDEEMKEDKSSAPPSIR
jgi:hypothetical protein